MNHTIMKTFSSLFLLGAVGALSAAASSAIAAVDTSLWKCETCPFEKAGAGGNVDAGVGAVSDEASKFGDYTGLHKNGAFAVLGGTARYRGDGGLFGSATANDLGLDSRSLAAELGQEGLYTLRLSYAEIPRWFTMGAKTPFLGNGSGQLTLAPGFVRAGNTAGMSLAADLQAIELGFKRTRLDLGAALNTGEGWTHRIDVRRDERSGTRRGAGAFFASSLAPGAAGGPCDRRTRSLDLLLHAAVAGDARLPGLAVQQRRDRVDLGEPLRPQRHEQRAARLGARQPVPSDHRLRRLSDQPDGARQR